MKTILKIMAVAGLTLSLTACALLGSFGLGQGGQDAARGALTAYELAQEAALIYAALPLCKPELPNVKICRDQAIWKKIKAAEDVATNAIVTAAPVLRGDQVDAGEIAGVLLKLKALSAELGNAQTKLGK